MVTTTVPERAVLANSAPASYVVDAAFTAQPVTRSTPLPVYESREVGSTYFSGVDSFTPAETATDFMALQPVVYGRTAMLDSITISGTATTAATVDLRLQRSANGGGGTSSALIVGKADQSDAAASTNVYSYTVNRSSNGDGIDNTRQLIHSFKLNLRAAGTAATPYKITFTGAKRPSIKDLYEWLVLNWNGQAVPAGTSLSVMWEWSEYGIPNVIFAGDSTTSNANFLFTNLGLQGDLNSVANVRNCGSNGYKMNDFLLTLNGIPYQAFGALGVASRVGSAPPKCPGVIVMSYGINDIRQGATTKDQIISMIDAWIYGTLNGTTSGGTYTSPMGAGTTFTWPATQAAQPDTKIILWGPNSFTSDDPGSTGYVTLTGQFTGMTIDQAAQKATNDLYDAYDAFKNDSRIFRLVQKQDVTGRMCQPNATSGLMTDILHPNEKGQVKLSRQIVPHIIDAIHAARCDSF